MLDHDHRVAEVAQPLQGREQPVVVALMEADRRLVQDIEHAGQARADLRGEPDALALAARERARRAREGQVLEPDIAQESQALVDLLQDALGDVALFLRELLLQRTKPVARVEDREIRHLADVELVDLDGQGFGLEAPAVAGLARRLVLVAAQFLLEPGAVGLAPAPLHVGDDALVRPRRRVSLDAVVIAHRRRARRPSRRGSPCGRSPSDPSTACWC